MEENCENVTIKKEKYKGSMEKKGKYLSKNLARK